MIKLAEVYGLKPADSLPYINDGLPEIEIDNVKISELSQRYPRKVSKIWVFNTKITSLKGLPETCTGPIVIRSNKQLKSLEYLTKSIGGSLLIHENALESLIGCPPKVNDDFGCHGNPLSTLRGAPKVVRGHARIGMHPKLTSLHGIGTEFLQKVGSLEILGLRNVTSHALGLLLIDADTPIDFTFGVLSKGKIADGLLILNKYFQTGGTARDKVIDCQHELIDNGFSDLAQL